MRKKKDCLLAVLLAVCFLCGCSASVYLRSPEEPQIQFYYCVRESADAKTGALTATPASVPDSSPAAVLQQYLICLLYTSPSPRDSTSSRMPSSA